jgi:hypothetical protein
MRLGVQPLSVGGNFALDGSGMDGSNVEAGRYYCFFRSLLSYSKGWIAASLNFAAKSG